MNGGRDLQFFDKVETKFSDWGDEQFAKAGVRVCHLPSRVKYPLLAKGAILMPSYVNIGAYVDEGTMVDTWATVGSCAQIGKTCIYRRCRHWRCSLSRYKPTQPSLKTTALSVRAQKSLKVWIVEEGSVISMGVYIGQSTKNPRPRNRRNNVTAVFLQNSVVVSGSLLCNQRRVTLALLCGNLKRDAQTRSKNQ